MTRRPFRNFPSEGIEKRLPTKQGLQTKNLLHPLDDTAEFHDPYSELNLFLSQKIKREMHHCSNSKKWSLQLQEELLSKITPEFQARFPKYRLGVTALKKTWEKVNYFATQIQEEREALTQDGRLNLPFFIKKNLRSASKLKNTCHYHPYHYAHQLAVKMGECIAVVDGIRPKLDQLTQTIWSLQRHLIPDLSPEHFRSPYDEYEQIDKLIVSTILEICADHPTLSQAELAFHVQKQLVQIHSIAATHTPFLVRKMLTALYADQCHLPSQRMEKTLEKIPYPIAKCLKKKLAAIVIDTPSANAVEEAFDFFFKAHAAMEEFEEIEIERKIQNWTIQGDLLLRFIRLDHTSALYKEMDAIFSRECPTDFHRFVKSVREAYLVKHPELLSFALEIETRAWIYLKYIWYTKGFSEETPTYDRFIKWQRQLLRHENLSAKELFDKVEMLSKKMLPLLPFNRTRAQTILVTEEEI